MTFDTLKLSNDLQDAYEELNKERQKVRTTERHNRRKEQGRA
jgi:hypothetical protein